MRLTEPQAHGKNMKFAHRQQDKGESSPNLSNLFDNSVRLADTRDVHSGVVFRANREPVHL
jgi:hypothetical protein